MDTDKHASKAAASADRLASEPRNEIQDTHLVFRAAGSKLTDRADEPAARAASKANQAVNKASGRTKEGIKGVRNAVQSGRKSLSQSSDAIRSFSSEKPVQALLISAVWTFICALASAMGPSRN